MPDRARGARGLVFRLYAIGLVQLALVAVAAVVIGALVARLPGRVDVPHLTQRLSSVAPADLDAALHDLGDRYGVRLSVYRTDGELVATNVRPPLSLPRWGTFRDRPDGPGPHGDHHFGPPPPDGPPLGPPPGPPPDLGHPPPDGPSFGPPPFGPPPHGDGPHGPPPVVAEVALAGAPHLLVARFDPPKPSDWPPILTLVAGLVVVGAGAWLTARWIARPLEELARAARALGEGDLRARANLPGTDMLADVGRTFDEMAGRIAASIAAEKELLANVSHELRTPLARIRVALDLAAEGDGEAARASMAEIGVDLEELEAILNDVLQAARLGIRAEGTGTATGFALHFAQQDGAAIVDAAAERFRAHHPDRPFSAQNAGPGLSVRADPVLFRRVLDNLLENADKYSPDRHTPITLRVARVDDGVRFEVQDAGMGIAAPDLPHVFSPFFRAERSRSRGSGGVGLGLTLVKRITDAHGGTIAIESEVGRGTTVRVTLPPWKGASESPTHAS